MVRFHLSLDDVTNVRRERIMTYLKDFGKHYRIEIDESIFQEFVEKYDEFMYTREHQFIAVLVILLNMVIGEISEL